jgi:hypothetical protein
VVGRIFTLLVLAAAAGVAAELLANSGGDESASAAHIPVIPVVESLSGAQCPIPERQRAAFVEASSETQLPLALLTAVGQVASPSPAPQSVLGGARYLRAQFDRFGSSDLALAAYAQGPAVTEAGRSPSGETLTYVADVTAVWRALAGCG